MSTGTAANSSNNDVAVTRLLPNGALDAAFGVGGKTTVPFDLVSNAFDVGFDIVEQTDGSLDIVGEAGSVNATYVAAAMRLTPDGVLDARFGNSGKRTYTLGQNLSAFTGALLRGGDLIATGVVDTPSGADNVVAAIHIDTLFANGFD